ncbi:MAG: hypothetical protein M0Z55_11225 [Peptococcaceae bacterium]|nr:hypothetical protein [Peptococcaceae bacterium]
MLNICFTADHELFFGRNYVSEEEVLIQPTYRLIEVLEQYNIPLCLMTDVCSISRYQELAVASPYVALIEAQLRTAIARGHDVQLHIHSHWVSSSYADGQWQFDYTKYRLHSLGFGVDSLGQRIIEAGKQYLVNLLQPVDANYACVAFRAGGWCLQPEADFMTGLASTGISIDTTVFPGGYRKNSDQFFDFRHLPSTPNWWIDPHQGLEIAADKSPGCIFEVTIGAYNFGPLLPLRKLILKPARMRSQAKVPHANGISMDGLYQQGKVAKVTEKLSNFLSQPILFTFDGACHEVMLFIVDYYLSKYDCQNRDIYISLIGHPKGLNETSLAEIAKFCATVSDVYRESVQFIRLRDIPQRT